jgi:hypothetical protein
MVDRKFFFVRLEAIKVINMENNQTEPCCTPEGQIKRYLNCIGCDRKPYELKSKRKYYRIIIEDHGIAIPDQLIRTQSEIDYEEITNSNIDVLEKIFKHTLERLKRYGK